MKTKKLFSRHNLLWLIILSYLLPLVALISYNIFSKNGSQDWSALSIGLFLASCGALLIFWAMTRWEASLGLRKSEAHVDTEDDPSIDPEDYSLLKLSLDEAQQMQVRLLSEIDSLTEELQKAKTDKKSIEAHTSELENVKLSFEKQLEQQQIHIRNLQETIAEQKAMVEKKQQQTSLLESKVGDLTYEIKTLLQLAEAHSGSLFSDDPEPELKAEPAPIEVIKTSHEPPATQVQPQNHFQTAYEGSQQLKRCLDIAQKITGSQRFGSQLYTFSDSPAESFALDLRRLCDRLRSDTSNDSGTVLVYSPKEKQLLFAGNQIRDLTGWSPEKFIQTFSEILQDEETWKHGVSSLSMRSEAQIQLSLKSRSGQVEPFQAHLGTIPTGIFRNHVIAVVYQAETK